MLAELTQLFDATPAYAKRDGYAEAIIEGNCLSKPTAATRRLTNQRLGEMYGLDPATPAFRVLRSLWSHQPDGRALLAILMAIARDPLLAATAAPVVLLPPGADFRKEPMRKALQALVGERLNSSTLDKVCRNAASSWAQSGHLQGRTFKTRKLTAPTPLVVAFAMYLSHAAGFRGEGIFSSAWLRVVDCDPSRARHLALEAKRIGLIDLRMSGEVIELNMSRLDPHSARS